MGTSIRPEVSKKNQYWIDRHRYYELKHFCLQYPTWKKAYVALDGLSKHSPDLSMVVHTSNTYSNPTAKCAEARVAFLERMEMVEKAATLTDPVLWSYILKAVTEGVSYTYLKSKLDIPCCKDTYYDLRRKFFWLLNRVRD